MGSACDKVLVDELSVDGQGFGGDCGETAKVGYLDAAYVRIYQECKLIRPLPLRAAVAATDMVMQYLADMDRLSLGPHARPASIPPPDIGKPP